MKIIGANITGSFILNNQDVTNTLQSSSVWSGSVAAEINSLNAASASLNSATASLNSATASLYAATASLNSATASLNTFTASAATTGSNTFNGNQIVSGSLTVTGSITTPGTLTAQTLVVQTVTSSTVYSSGSNIFGNNISNTQVLTGSVYMTGSLNTVGNAYLGGDTYITGGNGLYVKGNNSQEIFITSNADSTYLFMEAYKTSSYIPDRATAEKYLDGYVMYDKVYFNGDSGSYMDYGFTAYPNKTEVYPQYRGAVELWLPTNNTTGSFSIRNYYNLSTNYLAKFQSNGRTLLNNATDNGINTLQVSGSIFATSLTGSLSGTATNATSASYAANSTNADTASFVTLAQTASFVTTSQTASFVTTAQTASFVTLAQTASFITTAQTASFVANAQSASNAVTAQTASFANSFTVANTLTAQTLVVQTITSSVDFVTGSTRFGSLSSNTHTFTGSILTSGSIVLNNSQSISFNSSISDQNWSIYRNTTASFTKSLAIGPSFNINAHYGTNEGFAIGGSGGSSYYEILGSLTTPTHFFRGSVGIGNTNPSYTLDVSGTGRMNVTRTNGTNTNALVLSDNLTGVSTAGFGTRVIGYSNNNAVVSAIGFENGGTGTNNESQLSFYTQNVAGALTRQMVVTSTGNVGIGGNGSNYRLDVVNNGASAFIGVTNQSGAGGDRYLRMGFGSGVTFASIQATRLSVADDVVLALQPGGGNVGIGTTNPTSILNVVSSVNNGPLAPEGQTRLFNTFDGGAATIGFSSNSGGAQDGRAGIAAGKDSPSGINGFLAFSVRQNAGAFVETMRLTSTSRVGMFTTNPSGSVSSNLLHVDGQGSALRVGPCFPAMNGSTDRDFLEILPGGTTTTILAPNETFLLSNPGGGAGSWAIDVIAGSGGVRLTNGSTSWAAISDIRQKDIIEPITDAISKVSTLSTVIYKFKDDETEQRRVGLIAQEVNEVLPEAVNSFEDEEKMWSVRYTELIPLLTKAIQELNTKLDAANAEIEALKAK